MGDGGLGDGPLREFERMVAELVVWQPADLDLLDPNQQIAASWIWFDMWEVSQRKRLFGQLLSEGDPTHTVTEAEQDELTALLSGMQLREKPAPNLDYSSPDEAAYQQQKQQVVHWYNGWAQKPRWQFLAGCQAMDQGTVLDFFNASNDMQV